MNRDTCAGISAGTASVEKYIGLTPASSANRSNFTNHNREKLRAAVAAHLWSSGIGVVVMNAGLIALYGGHPGAEPAAAIGSILVILGMILFALVAFRTTGPASDH